MKTRITLQQAFYLLNSATALTVDNDLLVYPSLEDLTGDKDHFFMEVASGDHEVYFPEGKNKRVKLLSDSSIRLKDDRGISYNITFLHPEPIDFRILETLDQETLDKT